MEELLELKAYLIHGNVPAALHLADELIEMSKDDKINKIYSYGKILLLHLIKQAAENRTTRSWELSIANATMEIRRTNRRRKTKGTYLTPEELREALQDAYPIALRAAATEAFEGRYEAEELAERVQREEILAQAMELLQ